MVGLVAITPAAGFVDVRASIFIGFVAAIISNYAAHWRSKTGLDDTLDVFPCHGLGGIVGMLLTAVFAKDVGLMAGETHTFLVHVGALVGITVFSLGGSWLLFKLTGLIIPLRVTPDEEDEGLDASQHGERFGPAAS